MDETNAFPRATASVTLLASAVPMSLATMPERGAPPMALLRSLRGRFDWRGGRAKRAITAVKYLARSVLMLRPQRDYLRFIEAHPAMAAFRRRDPRMLERHFHRYLHRGWHRRQRLQAIRHHYHHALATLPAPLFRAIYVEGGAPLGMLVLKDGSRTILSLRPPIFLGAEGELCIQLGDEHGNALYRIVVSVIDARPTLAIGCLQGPDGADARETVRALTRNLHGMRPKCLMLALAYALARRWGAQRILAVGNEAHPLRNARRRFLADYDGFWVEQQGRALAGGWFELPLQPSHKSEAEVPSHHRSAFRKREALRLAAESLLLGALDTAAESPRLPVRRRSAVGGTLFGQGALAEAS